MEAKDKKTKLYVISAAVAVVAVVTAVILIFRGGQESYRSIRVTELKGNVSIDREDVGSLDASVNMNLVSGDRISTDADSYAVLRLDDDKYIMLGEQGAIQVVASGNAADNRTQIHLEAGSIVSDIQNPLSQDSSYEVVTPSATMSVRGTVFEARWNPDESVGELLTYEGSVAVALGDEDPILNTHGEYTQFKIDDGSVPQFVVEREAITKEQIDLQMVPFLYQINETEEKELDFGEGSFEELIEQAREEGFFATGVVKAFETQEPSATPPAVTAALKVETSASSAPSPEATQTPAATPKPTSRPASTPAPEQVPSPTQAPTAEPTAQPESEQAPAAPSTSVPAPKPAPTAGPVKPPFPTADPVWPPFPTVEPTMEPAPERTKEAEISLDSSDNADNEEKLLELSEYLKDNTVKKITVTGTVDSSSAFSISDVIIPEGMTLEWQAGGECSFGAIVVNGTLNVSNGIWNMSDPLTVFGSLNITGGEIASVQSTSTIILQGPGSFLMVSNATIINTGGGSAVEFAFADPTGTQLQLGGDAKLTVDNDSIVVKDANGELDAEKFGCVKNGNTWIVQ